MGCCRSAGVGGVPGEGGGRREPRRRGRVLGPQGLEGQPGTFSLSPCSSAHQPGATLVHSVTLGLRPSQEQSCTWVIHSVTLALSSGGAARHVFPQPLASCPPARSNLVHSVRLALSKWRSQPWSGRAARHVFLGPWPLAHQPGATLVHNVTPALSS